MPHSLLKIVQSIKKKVSLTLNSNRSSLERKVKVSLCNLAFLQGNIWSSLLEIKREPSKFGCILGEVLHYTY